MSTISQPLKFLWTAYFADGKVLTQPADDRYSKHDDSAEHNPSAFRDLQEYQKKSDLIYFDINDGTFAYGIDLRTLRFGINGTWFTLDDVNEPLTDTRLEYWRAVQRDDTIKSVDTKQNDGTVKKEIITTPGEPYFDGYFFGYSGLNSKGERKNRVIRID